MPDSPEHAIHTNESVLRQRSLPGVPVSPKRLDVSTRHVGEDLVSQDDGRPVTSGYSDLQHRPHVPPHRARRRRAAGRGVDVPLVVKRRHVAHRETGIRRRHRRGVVRPSDGTLPNFGAVTSIQRLRLGLRHVVPLGLAGPLVEIEAMVLAVERVGHVPGMDAVGPTLPGASAPLVEVRPGFGSSVVASWPSLTESKPRACAGAGAPFRHEAITEVFVCQLVMPRFVTASPSNLSTLARRDALAPPPDPTKSHGEWPENGLLWRPRPRSGPDVGATSASSP